jgi:crossover junction endodeoxyribonuclease RuvC
VIYIGIDPGQSGGVALLMDKDSIGGPQAIAEKWTSEADMRDYLRKWWSSTLMPDGIVALIERVHAFPGQGVASTFRFGQNYGFWRGLLCALRIPYEEVSPGVWQGALGCRSGGDKNVTKTKAAQLFPQIKVTHAIADALLIAEYCRRTRNGA